MRHGRSGVCFLVVALACAGTTESRDSEPLQTPGPWTRRAIADSPDDFRFAVLGDRTGGHRDGVFARALDAAALLRPAFVFSVGDLIEGGTEDPERLATMWDEFDALVARLDMPFFYVPGNHDYSNPVMAQGWTRRFGPSFHHFRYKDVLFLVLNSELFSSHAQPGQGVTGGASREDQHEFVETALAEHADARWTFVLLHQPLWEIEAARDDWERVEMQLGERPYTVIAGHFHAYLKRIRKGRDYIILGTAGGASRLRGVDRGEFDHVTLVTMSEDGPVIANLALDGVHDVDVYDEPARSLMAHLDRVVTTAPLSVSGERFSGAEQRFVLHNRSRQPVTVNARFAASPDFAVVPETIERVLAPRSSETLAVTLRAAQAKPVARITPALAHWRVETAGRQRPRVVESTSWLIPEQRFAIPRAKRPLEIDGDLSDWGTLRFAQEAWPDAVDGPAAASLRFDVRADDDFLYLAIDVADATPVYAADLAAHQQDGVSVAIDARPEAQRSRNTGLRQAIDDGSFASLLITTLGPVEAKPHPVIARFAAPLPEGLRRAVRERAGGYRAELAVPNAFLDAQAGASWRGLRLNLVLQDAETPGGSVREHAWRPQRFGDPASVIEGAGSFVRE